MSICTAVSCIVERECLLWMFSCQNSAGLCPASLCTPRSNLPVILGISWLPTFAFQSPMMKRTSFLVLVLESVVGLHRTNQLQLQHQWLGPRLRLLWCWMVYLGNEPRSFCCFWDCTEVLHFRLLLTMRATPFLLSFLPTTVDIMVIWIKFTHSRPF